MKKIKIEEKEIDQIIEEYLPRTSDKNRQAIKMFFLEGKKLTQISKINNVSLQRIHAVLKKFLNFYLKYQKIPNNYQGISLFVSPDVYKKIKENPIDIVLDENNNLIIKKREDIQSSSQLS